MKVAINAANLHLGGGIQVAVSFLQALLDGDFDVASLAVFASSEVDKNLRSAGADPGRFAHYQVHDVYGARAFVDSRLRQLDDYDVVFTVFGPAYLSLRRARSVVGFAQAWILYPDNDMALRLPLLQRYLTRLKFFLQWLVLRRADALVVEAEHVRRGLVARGYPARQIHVAPNCIAGVYLDAAAWQPIRHTVSRDVINIGFLGRDWVHKNTGVMPEVAGILRQRYGLQVRFHVTFTEQEWSAKPAPFRQAVANAGPLSVAQCPTFYQMMDGVIFPSLLECFSVTPLEALVMERPLFASARSFVTELCGEHAHYFDPLDPAAIAAVIAGYYRDGQDQTEAARQRLQAGRAHALAFSSPQRRAQQYLAAIQAAAAR